MRRMVCRGMVLVGLVLSAGIAAAAAAKVPLSAQDQKLLAAATCGANGLDSATGRSGLSGPEASVRCRPHGKEGQVPVARVAQCQKAAGAWKCAPARDALMLTMADDSVLALVAEG